ncbi:cytochrome oxidase subunit III [Melampsora americana]|nr:cytochrome oxidase subunit III [Melampsora americana]
MSNYTRRAEFFLAFAVVDVISEGTFIGNHTLAVQKGLNMEAINAFELPLLNTVLLLASGVTITYCHHSVIQGERNASLYGAAFTIILALIFTGFQGVEYSVSSFTISDGAFGSCFYFGTGFHGLHVIVGTIFLAYQLTENHHLGLESGILY